MKRSRSAPLYLSLGAILVVLFLHGMTRVFPSLNVLQRLEWMTYDWRVRQAYAHPLPVATNLGVVFIDDESLELVNRGLSFKWPWPRQLYGHLINALGRQGVRAVAFDILFQELHPPDSATAVPVMEGVTMNSDNFLAVQMARWSNVVLAAFGETLMDRWLAIPPADLFRTNAWALGHATSEADTDGVLRRARPFREDPRLGRIWHLGIVMAAKELGLDLGAARVGRARIEIPGQDGVSRTIPLDDEGLFYINWGLRWNDPRIAQESFEVAAEFVASPVSGSPIDWKNRLVFVGSIGSGNNISDVGTTPLGRDTYLVSKHWNVANSILTGQFVAPKSNGLEMLLIVLLGSVATVGTWRIRAPWPTVLILALGLVFVAASVYLFNHHRFWLPLVFPLLGGLFVPHAALVTYQVLFEQRQSRHVRGVFSKVVSPDVVNELLQAEKLNLGGARRRITVMFADVRGFTEMTVANQELAEEYAAQRGYSEEEASAYFDRQARLPLATVNEYLGAIADQIKKHEGTLDKYIGDCVMAFWGAPLDNERHASAAVLAAIAAQRAIEKLNHARSGENIRISQDNENRLADGLEPLPFLPLLAFGTGINTGHAIVGLMGSEDHILNYTVFGRDVNLASRLETFSGRGRIIIGEETYADLKKHEPALASTCQELDPIVVKGFRSSVKVFEVPWRPVPPAPNPPAAAGSFQEEKKGSSVEDTAR